MMKLRTRQQSYSRLGKDQVGMMASDGAVWDCWGSAAG
jgi:hypothetical protein